MMLKIKYENGQKPSERKIWWRLQWKKLRKEEKQNG